MVRGELTGPRKPGASKFQPWKTFLKWSKVGDTVTHETQGTRVKPVKPRAQGKGRGSQGSQDPELVGTVRPGQEGAQWVRGMELKWVHSLDGSPVWQRVGLDAPEALGEGRCTAWRSCLFSCSPSSFLAPILGSWSRLEHVPEGCPGHVRGWGVPWLGPPLPPPAYHILFTAPITLLSFFRADFRGWFICALISAGSSERGNVKLALFCGHGISQSLPFNSFDV